MIQSISELENEQNVNNDIIVSTTIAQPLVGAGQPSVPQASFAHYSIIGLRLELLFEASPDERWWRHRNEMVARRWTKIGNIGGFQGSR